MSSFIKKRDENCVLMSAQRRFPPKLRGRYDGNGDVEKFLKVVIADKKLGNIEDRFALQMIANMLEGDAATWWQIVAQSINTWEEAVKMMREKFTPKKPAYRIYLQLFRKQSMNQRCPTKKIAKFVSEKIRLFARLPAGKFDEKTQVDMIYALLHCQYRKRLQRDEVASLGELIEKGRSIEKIVAADMKNKRGRKIRRVGQKMNCRFCSGQGHVIKNCLKREELEEEAGVVCSAREIVEAMNKKLSIKMN